MTRPPFPDGTGLGAHVKEAAFIALGTGAENILTLANDKANIKTGTLRRSGTVTTNQAKMSATISYNTPYAEAVHEGSPPHVIEAREAKVLAAPSKDYKGHVNPYGSGMLPQRSKDGQYVILGKRVHHPGYKGNPWLKTTVEANIDKLGRYIQLSAIDALREGLRR